ncbi:MAG: AAA family ATPase [SAR324 cluster bacterium]|nr:AAA family ATPase [SAR324 cluster bacterium]
MIFYGPPGTGKTFFAKAIATAMNAAIFIVSGSELKSKWVGESEANLRQVFAKAHQSAPSIIVFDELDSFASARGTYEGSGVEHSMVNQLLTEMDGFRKEEMVFVVGTTNFVESLDHALMRPGRFELAIEIPYPEAEDRQQILQIYLDKFQLKMESPELQYLVKRTEGYADNCSQARYSGDHLNAIVRALKREALRRGNPPIPITRAEIDQVLNKSGHARPLLSPEEEHTISAHESGHALVAHLLPNAPVVEQISIESTNDG